ncbi:MAG: ubiquitin-like small modifier protein 1 [Actinomycetota bacterium]
MSSISVRIPTVLRPAANGQSVVNIGGSTVGEVVEGLVADYPGLQTNLLDDDGDLRKFVNVYVNDEDIRFLDKLETTVAAGDDVTILPAVAGG